MLRHGDVIDLGDRAFEVLHLPGHSSGSVGLFDRRSGQFFSGDVVYDGELLDELEDSVIDDYLVSMERLLRLAPRSPAARTDDPRLSRRPQGAGLSGRGLSKKPGSGRA